MGKPLIIVGSITYAIKGRNLLARRGIRSYVERAPSCGDCEYCIYVPDRTDEAEEILFRHGVRVAGRAERGDA